MWHARVRPLHVHVKNTEWTRTQPGWQGQFVGLDRGLVNWSEVIAALRSVGYRGWLSLEDFSSRPLEQKLREGKLILSRLFGQRARCTDFSRNLRATNRKSTKVGTPNSSSGP